MKRCKIRIEHSSYPPFKLMLLSGTRVSAVLAFLNLDEEDYVLCPTDDPNKHYTSTEALYDLIQSDAKLIAKLSPEAEGRYAQLFMQ